MPPTLEVALYIFEHVFTLDELEGFICTYEPEGIDLQMLRILCGFEVNGLVGYRGVLIEVATRLLYVGHQLSPLHILQEMGLVFLPYPVPQIQV
jgi:hypothetical protein